MVNSMSYFICIRRCRLTVVGPWQTAGSLELIDLSLQVDPLLTTSDPVVMWAVGANGDVLCRYGITASNPLVSPECIAF